MYERLVASYDWIFPFKQSTFDFLSHRLPRGRVLDAACGTGTYTIALAENGYQAAGVDLDGEMIKKARRKAEAKNLDVPFYIQDLRALAVGSGYLGVFCIGNSLVHLRDEQEVRRALAEFHEILRPGGSLIVQIINYDRILDQQIEGLPTLGDQTVSLTRRYRHQRNKIRFETTLPTPEGRRHGTVELLPIKSRQLEAMLEASGFIVLARYGSFQGEPFHPNVSMSLIVHARRTHAKDRA